MSNGNKKAVDVINQAASALQLYADYYGSSTSAFANQLDLVVEILKAAAENAASAYDAAQIRAYADALTGQIRPNG